MIDWLGLVGNSFWILGCALALSTLSFASWQASLNKERLRIQLNKLGYQIAFHIAGVLFCVGLAITSDNLVERLLWVILAGLFIISLLREIYRR